MHPTELTLHTKGCRLAHDEPIGKPIGGVHRVAGEGRLIPVGDHLPDSDSHRGKSRLRAGKAWTFRPSSAHCRASIPSSMGEAIGGLPSRGTTLVQARFARRGSHLGSAG